MTADIEISDKIIAAVTAHTGVRPATPIAGENAAWWPFDARRYAVGLTPAVVEVRVVATALPLPALLDELAAALRPLLAETPWEAAELRLMVTELDAAALPAPGGDAQNHTGA